MAASFDVLIVGGGAAGITIAAAFRRRNRQLKVGLIEPNETHYYQPALTLVGAGEQTVAQNTRLEAHLIPDNTTWIKDSAVGFEPEENTVLVEKGDPVGYDYLVVCPLYLGVHPGANLSRWACCLYTYMVAPGLPSVHLSITSVQVAAIYPDFS